MSCGEYIHFAFQRILWEAVAETFGRLFKDYFSKTKFRSVILFMGNPK